MADRIDWYRMYRAIEYTAHQARVGPSRLLTRMEGNETIREHFATHPQ